MMNPSLLEKLNTLEKRYEALLSDLVKTGEKGEVLVAAAKERAAIEDAVLLFRDYKRAHAELSAAQQLLAEGDQELKPLALDEIACLNKKISELEKALKFVMLPKSPYDSKDVILEVRAGAGGQEAALFVVEMLRMYTKFAQLRGWEIEILSQNPTDLGGLREVIASVRGKKVYSTLKYEGGVHRVQRVPQTEAQGRIHTSTVTVAIMPEAEEVEIEIDPKDLRIDVFRSSGPGGQSVNTTDSAVRITHIPTGMVVTCQDERSQHKNKAKALRILRSRLLEKKKEEQEEALSEQRKSLIGSGDRSERIRTYNFPQNRVTDHRIGLTLKHLDTVLEGDLDEIIENLILEEENKLFSENV